MKKVNKKTAQGSGGSSKGREALILPQVPKGEGGVMY